MKQEDKPVSEKANDFLLYDEKSGTWQENPEQVVRDDVEKHYWLHVGRTILKDWRLYIMLVPMLLVFLFWRYMPMYELLGCFKVSDTVLPVSEQLFSGFSYFRRLLFSGDAPESVSAFYLVSDRRSVPALAYTLEDLLA